MKTLVFILPASRGGKPCEYIDFDIGCGTVRLIYYNENTGAFGQMYQKHKISKLIKGCAICTGAESFAEAETFYKDGCALALFYIKQICLSALDGERGDIIICSKDFNDCEALRDIISSFNVKILTKPELVPAFCGYLAEEFGIAGGAAASVHLRGKCVIVMKGCEGFSLNGAGDIINLSGASLEIPSITPKTIRFTQPAAFSGIAPLGQCDFLQTALDFFEMPYENLSLLSLKTGI